MADPFIGEIRAVGFTYAPYGWAVCNGSVLAISQNSALFALFGILYGGDGVSTFGIPDLRSRVIVGTGQGAGLSGYTQGETGGIESMTASTVLTAGNMPQHTHTADISGLTSEGIVTINCNDTAGTQTTGDQAYLGKAGAVNGKTVYDTNVYNTAVPDKTMNSGTASFSGSIGGSITVSVSGLSSPSPVSVTGDNRQPFQSLLYIVALQGIFPSRG
jgi:microcystin-dependent protein